MTRATRPFVVLLLAVAGLAACGPSQAELDAQATEVAESIFATQTAEAPTATPTPTATPAPTATPIPTETPRPLSDAVLTLDDLPEGFEEGDAADFGLEPGGLAYFVALDSSDESRIESGFAYVIETEDAFQIVAGATALFPSRLDRAQFAPNIPPMLDAFLFGVGLVGQNPDDMQVEELPQIVVGDASGGVTSVVDLGGLLMRFDVALFSRGQLAAVVIAVYLDGDEPVYSLLQAAETLDQRIIEVVGAE